jgi:hypothetical protein
MSLFGKEILNQLEIAVCSKDIYVYNCEICRPAGFGNYIISK